ncbi:MAG: nucleotide exchange factor GrpE [Cyclonatronaceae bacterium]
MSDKNKDKKSGASENSVAEEDATFGQNEPEVETTEGEVHEQQKQESGEGDSALAAENERLREELEQQKQQVLRKVAEFENIKKRTQRERTQLFTEAKANAIKDFLPVYDDLSRSLAEENVPKEVPESFMNGLKMVHAKFLSTMKQYGVEPINESGVPFDVNLHDALLRQPAPDEKTGSDVVLQVLEPGYKMGEKVIRHAKVIVSE